MTSSNTPEQTVYLAALKALSHRALTRKELQDKLQRKKFDRGLVEDAIRRCLDDGFIKEREIAEDHIRRGIEYRLVGRFMLRHELIGKGIAEGMVGEILEEIYPAVLEKEVAIKFARRKLRSLENLPAETVYRRLGSAVSRRGFSSETVSSIMREMDFGRDG